jgi:ornithine carbamoyltransferase
MRLGTKDFLRVLDLEPGAIDGLLDLASEMKLDRKGFLASFHGGAVACYFEKPSTRTRVSFEVAAHRLGLLPIMLKPDELQIGRGETVSDTSRVLSGYADALVMRVFSHKMLGDVAGAATVPVINALSDDHHPCQALADLLTIRERFGVLKGLRVAYLGDANNVAQSLMEAGALMGMHIVVASPPGYRPDPELEHEAADIAADSGGSISVVNDPVEAAIGADVIYSDVFVSMGDDAEAQVRRVLLAPYRVTTAIMDAAGRDAIFMHCLPAHRGEEVDAEVIDGSASVVFQQAANRMPTEQALLYSLISGAGSDARQDDGRQR